MRRRKYTVEQIICIVKEYCNGDLGYESLFTYIPDVRQWKKQAWKTRRNRVNDASAKKRIKPTGPQVWPAGGETEMDAVLLISLLLLILQPVLPS